MTLFKLKISHLITAKWRPHQLERDQLNSVPPQCTTSWTESRQKLSVRESRQLAKASNRNNIYERFSPGGSIKFNEINSETNSYLKIELFNIHRQTFKNF